VAVPKYPFVAKKHSNVGTTKEALITTAVKSLHGRCWLLDIETCSRRS
jgi:hypothetical protein